MDAQTIEIAFKVGGIVFACGLYFAELKAIRKDIARLEQKVEKHNNFDRRIVKLETIVQMKGEQNAAK